MQIITVTCSKRPSMWLSNVIPNIERQRRPPDASLLVIHPKNFAIDGSIKKMLLSLPSSLSIEVGEPNWNHGEISNYAFTKAENKILTGFMVTMDDDDYYGTGYLEEVERTFMAHSDAVIIGKRKYNVRRMDGRVNHPDCIEGGPPADSEGRVIWVGGPTISINVDAWRNFPSMRYPPIPVDADGLLQYNAHLAWAYQGNRGNLKTVNYYVNGELSPPFAPIYTTGTDEFFCQRYSSEHGHGWHMVGER